MANRKNGIEVRDAVEERGSFMYNPTINDKKHNIVAKITVFFIPNATVNVFLSIASSPSLSGIFASKTIDA